MGKGLQRGSPGCWRGCGRDGASREDPCPAPLTGVARASALHSLQFPASRKSFALTCTTCSSPAKASVITSDRFTVSTCAAGDVGHVDTPNPGPPSHPGTPRRAPVAAAYHGPGAVDDGAVLEPKAELEVGLLGPGRGVLPAHVEPPRGQGDRLHHQALWRVWLN